MASANIEVVEFGSFAQLRAACPGLAQTTPDTDPFLSTEWFELLAGHGMDAGTRPRIVATRDHGEARLILPLAGSRHVRAFANFYSCLYGPIPTRAGHDAADLDLLCRHLHEAAPRAAVLQLAPLDAQSAFARDMRSALRRHGFLVDHYFCFGNWYLPVAGRGFDAYAASLPGALRSTLARRKRLLERQGKVAFEIHRAPGAALEAAIVAFESVYAASWKVAEPFPRFIGELCRRAAARDWLRLGTLALDGRVIAAQIWLHAGGRAMIYKLAYESRYADFSPGTQLTAALMRNALDVERVSEVDYLSGDDAYKRDWMTHRRERIGLIGFNPRTLRGLAGAARHFPGRAWERARGGNAAGRGTATPLG